MTVVNILIMGYYTNWYLSVLFHKSWMCLPLTVSAQSFTRRPSNQRPVLGEDVTLVCAYSGSNLIYWRHRSTILFIGQTRQADVSTRFSLVNTSDLKITGVTLADSGVYECVPSGEKSAEATITVLGEL